MLTGQIHGYQEIVKRQQSIELLEGDLASGDIGSHAAPVLKGKVGSGSFPQRIGDEVADIGFFSAVSLQVDGGLGHRAGEDGFDLIIEATDDRRGFFVHRVAGPVQHRPELIFPVIAQDLARRGVDFELEHTQPGTVAAGLDDDGVVDAQGMGDGGVAMTADNDIDPGNLLGEHQVGIQAQMGENHNQIGTAVSNFLD